VVKRVSHWSCPTGVVPGTEHVQIQKAASPVPGALCGGKSSGPSRSACRGKSGTHCSRVQCSLTAPAHKDSSWGRRFLQLQHHSGAVSVAQFCVGEPGARKNRGNRVGTLLLFGDVAIWSFAPPRRCLQCVTGWAEAEPELTARLMLPSGKACRWLGSGGTRDDRVRDVPGPAISTLRQRSSIASDRSAWSSARGGDERVCRGFREFFAGAATFPWRSRRIMDCPVSCWTAWV
jgi:hypothetical protein